MRRFQVNGFGLVELLIAVGIMSLVSAIAYILVKRSTSSSNKAELLAVRASLVARISQVIRDPEALLESGEKSNRNLKNCVDEDAATPCSPIKYQQQQGFQLWLNPGGSGSGVQLTGESQAAPKEYGWRGESNCDSLSRKKKDAARCGAWKAESYYWVSCQEKTQVTCDNAGRLWVRFIVRFDAKPNGKDYSAFVGRPPKAIPDEASFRQDKASFAISLDFTKNLRDRGGACGPNKVQIGLNEDGTPKCDCVQNATKRNMVVNGQPSFICTLRKKDCPSGERLVGFDEKGDIICRRMGGKKVSCRSEKTFSRGSLNCAAEEWIEYTSMGTCRGKQRGGGKKSGPQTWIECDRNRGRCCGYRN